MSEAEDSLPRAFGDAVLRARIRTTAEDFQVDEIDGFAPSGAGEHLLLRLRKRGMNTGFVAKRLSQWAKVPEMAIGYAGMKDRHALTTQRFSVHLPKKVAPDIAALNDADLQVLESDWHSRKLPRGALAGNRFTLVLREVQGERDAIEQRFRTIAAQGVPNYFGEQRFGREGGNVEQARRMFAGARVGREQRSILLSAARSELFNRILAERVRRGDWNQAVEGDVWMLDGTHSIFGPAEVDDSILARMAEGDIHPTGALWGEGAPRSQGDFATLESAIADAEPALVDGLCKAGLKQERRSLRLRASEMSWAWMEPATLRLSFTLPAGSYATTVLHAVGDCVEAAATR